MGNCAITYGKGLREQNFFDLVALLEGTSTFAVPEFHQEWSTREILVMSYLDGQPIETAATASQSKRDDIVQHLIDLTLREVFEFNVIQSDPNFANFQYNS
ncbi:AarF/UbiB family protein [Lutimaribacter marinistellae]|uniref:AarF/UbiB family protein n=1 Tax=Lutimaribacter marinistellae TaxID=1820329 RepID=A0ABV7TGW4_9RHOB